MADNKKDDVVDTQGLADPVESPTETVSKTSLEAEAKDTISSKESTAPAKKTASVDEKSPVEPSVELSKEADKILQAVKKLPALELANLVKAMEEVFGVSAAAPVAMMPGVAGGGAAGEAAEKDSFDVELTSPGGSKINVIKTVKEITGLGLKEAKDMVDGVPKIIKGGLKKEEAEEIKTKLEEAGASVELK